jgi:hypothetical protein
LKMFSMLQKRYSLTHIKASMSDEAAHVARFDPMYASVRVWLTRGFRGHIVQDVCWCERAVGKPQWGDLSRASILETRRVLQRWDNRTAVRRQANALILIRFDYVLHDSTSHYGTRCFNASQPTCSQWRLNIRLRQLLTRRLPPVGVCWAAPRTLCDWRCSLWIRTWSLVFAARTVEVLISGFYG